VLGVEHLREAMFCSYENPPDKMDVLVAARDLARMQAHFWGDDRLKQWIPAFDSFDYVEVIQRRWTYYFRGLSRRFQQVCSADFFQFLRACAEENGISTFMKTLLNGPKTLVHGDLWINNFCFVKKDDLYCPPAVLFESSMTKLCIFDWQTCSFGLGVVDLASLVDTTQATEFENEILHLFWDTLMRNGVYLHQYPWDKFISDYKLAKRYSFLYHHPVMVQTALFTPKALREANVNDIFNR